jgi:protein-disulfide isomerase
MEEEINKGEEKEGKNLTESLRGNLWILSTFVLALFVVILLVQSFGIFSFTGNVISEDDAGKIIEGITGYTPSSIEEVSGMYKVNILYQGQTVSLYVTKDGKYAGQLSEVNTEAGGNSNSKIVEATIDDDAVIGNANAPVTIIEFSDYQCPFCRKFWVDTYSQIKSKYIDTGKAKLVFRDYPLNFHSMAQLSAEAAECVREKGGDGAYYKYHDKIFLEQQLLDSGKANGDVTTTVTYTKDDLKKWAKTLGYDIASCLDSGKFTEEVKKDLKDGQAAGISGTPAFVINGILISGAQQFSEFERIIEGELSG